MDARATPPDPVVSVVTPCGRGHAEALRGCLRGLAAQVAAPPHELIVVESGGGDAVAEVVAAFPAVRLVRGGRTLLPGDARNLGVAHARGEYLAFIDADCVPEPEWLGAAVEALRGGARVAGGPVTDALPGHSLAVADNLLQFADLPAERPDTPAELFPACNLAVRRADFDAIGGFRHGCPEPAGEDVAFCDDVLARWPGSLRFVRRMAVRHTGRTGFGSYLRHQHSFGYARGALGLRLRPHHTRYGRWAILLVPIALRRLAYILGRVAVWRPRRLARTLLLVPILLPGLIAWAVGFRQGLLASGGSRPGAT